VLFRRTFWAKLWSQLSEKEAGIFLKKNCRRLKEVMLEFCARSGWNFRRRVEY